VVICIDGGDPAYFERGLQDGIIPTVERELVIQALKETGGNQLHAAKLLGITRATLRKRVEKYGIQRELSIK
jgi:DNA-binding protein Fis